MDNLARISKRFVVSSAVLDRTFSICNMKVLEGHCIYLPHFYCTMSDYALLAALKKDLEMESLERRKDEADGDEEEPKGRGEVADGMINWSKHLRHENPDFSSTFKKIIDQMAEYFDVEVFATRLNYYRDGTDWKVCSQFKYT